MGVLVLVLLSAGCPSTSMEAITFPAVPQPAESEEELAFAWRDELPVNADAESITILVAGDAGVRADDKTRPSMTALAVAAAGRAACDGAGDCDASVFLGDNVYSRGVNNANDELYLDRFTRAWAFAAPVYFVPGNHDWGPTFGRDAPRNDRIRRQHQWIRSKPRDVVTRGGAHFYTFRAGPVQFWAVDSNYLVHKCKSADAKTDCDGPGIEAFFESIGVSEAPWKILLSHHPYRSDGEHGDAGRYRNHGIPWWRGRGYEGVISEHVRDSVDVLLSGHDHSLQFFADVGGETAQFVVGSSGKLDTLPQRQGQRAEFGQAGYHGFGVLEASPTRLCMKLFAVDVSPTGEIGRVVLEACRTRRRSTWSWEANPLPENASRRHRQGYH